MAYANALVKSTPEHQEEACDDGRLRPCRFARPCMAARRLGTLSETQLIPANGCRD